MQILLGIGSNQHAEENIVAAMRRLEALLPGVRFSCARIFPSAQGGDVPPYTNLAAVAETELTQAELKQHLRVIEAELGRDRNTPNCVAIDLDILAYGNTSDPDLVACEYCLLPASEVAPEFRPEGSSRTLRELAEHLNK